MHYVKKSFWGESQQGSTNNFQLIHQSCFNKHFSNSHLDQHLKNDIFDHYSHNNHEYDQNNTGYIHKEIHHINDYEEEYYHNTNSHFHNYSYNQPSDKDTYYNNGPNGENKCFY